MKKAIIFGAIFFASFGSAIQSYALRVLDYTYNCVGCGGNCLDTIVIKPEVIA